MPSRFLNPTTPGGLLSTITGLLSANEELVVQAITAGTYFYFNQTPTGSINDVNVTFTLAATPNPVSSLEVYLNGVRQTLTVNYSLVTATLTMVDPPATGDELRVNFTVSPV